jgi:Tol biopolymer transport system component
LIVSASGGRARPLSTGRWEDAEGYTDDPDWSPDGKKILFYREDHFGTAGIFVINIDGTHRRQIVPNGFRPAWSPDGHKIAFDDWNSIFVANPNGRARRRVTSAARELIRPAWSPDGKQFACEANTAGEGAIWVVNLDGSHARPIVKLHQADSPAWQPG